MEGCNAFASNFLKPADGVRDVLRDIPLRIPGLRLPNEDDFRTPFRPRPTLRRVPYLRRTKRFLEKLTFFLLNLRFFWTMTSKKFVVD